jgi:uncharacterized membrane protein
MPRRAGERTAFGAPIRNFRHPNRAETAISADQEAEFMASGETETILTNAEEVRRILRESKEEIERLEAIVEERLKEEKAVAENVNQQFERKMTFGERIADRVATFGGSWTFILIFVAVISVWMLVNSAQKKPFDPYPFILLNLLLSCVAALQAPVIMMSQNRQAAKDRLQAEMDYKTNLAAEVEIRNIDAKVDELLVKHWQRLLEIQCLQVELLEQVTADLSRQQAHAHSDAKP